MEFQKNFIATKLPVSSIETGLTNPDKYIKMLECKGDYEPCKNNEIRDFDLKQIFKSQKQDPVEESSEKILETSYSDPLMNDSIGDDTLRQINSAEILECKPTFRKPDYFFTNDSNTTKPNYRKIPTVNSFFPKTSLINKDPNSAASIEKSISNIGNALFGKSRNTQENKPNPPTSNAPQNSPFIPKTAINQKQEEVNKFPDFKSSREILLNNMVSFWKF